MMNNSYKDGKHLNSKYWKIYKSKIPNWSENLLNIAIGILLGDGCMYKKSNNPIIKLEQGSIHKDYLFHLYDLFKLYTFNEPYIRKEKKSN